MEGNKVVHARMLSSAVARITRIRFDQSEWPAGTLGDAYTLADLFIRWWHSDRHTIIVEKFNKRYDTWVKLKIGDDKVIGRVPLWSNICAYDDSSKEISVIDNQSVTEFGKAYFALQGLGIEILPLIVDQLQRKNYNLLPLFGDLTNGQGVTPKGSLDERIKFTLAWWKSEKDYWTFDGHTTTKDVKK
jgi:hypothetical protein